MNVPPRTLELPGPVATVVTPASLAYSKASSKGLIPSIALSCGVIGSLSSL